MLESLALRYFFSSLNSVAGSVSVKPITCAVHTSFVATKLARPENLIMALSEP